MIEFRVLGALHLASPDGRDLSQVLAQAKLLALLIYLTVARPRGFHRRDTLLALFWPDLDDKRARRALNQALYTLRRALGEEIIVRRGTEEVGVDRQRMSCDVVAFDRAIDEDRLEDALELYQGELLPGFHASASAGFEQWLDGERARIQQLAVRAAAAMSKRAEASGDLEAALKWAVWAHERAPDQEPAVRRLIEMLDRTGDRVGGLAVYEAFVARIQDEYGAEPAAETQALVAVIRERAIALDAGAASGAGVLPEATTSAVAPQSRWRLGHAIVGALAIVSLLAGFFVYRNGTSSDGVSPPTERAWILVAEFQGPMDDPGLAAAVRELVRSVLDQSSVVMTLPGHQVRRGLELAGRPTDADLDLDLARELAIRSSIRAVVTGRVDRVGDVYSLLVRVVDADSGKALVSETAVARGVNEVIPAVVRLGRAVREQLGERKQSLAATRRLMEAATPSLEAYRNYLTGYDRVMVGDYTGARRALRAAVRVDPQFAEAWRGLSIAYSNSGLVDSVPHALAQARRHRHRLTPDQALRLDAMLALDLRAAIRANEAVLELNPFNVGAYNGIALALERLGRYEEAIGVYDREATMLPFGLPPLERLNRLNSLIAVDRLEEARREAEMLSGTYERLAHVNLAMAAGQWQRAESVATILGDRGQSLRRRFQARSIIASTRAARGMLLSAQAILDTAFLELADNQMIRFMQWVQAQRLLVALATDSPLEEWPGAFEPDSSSSTLTFAGIWAAGRGQRNRATTLRGLAARALDDQVFPAYRAFDSRKLDLLEAWVEMANGNWPGVTQLLGSAAREGEPDVWGSHHVRWLVGEAYERMGMLDSAAVSFELLLLPTRIPYRDLWWRGYVHPLAHHRLGELYARLGSIEKAREHWQAFLETFTNPDPEYVHLVQKARRALAKEAQAAITGG